MNWSLGRAVASRLCMSRLLGAVALLVLGALAAGAGQASARIDQVREAPSLAGFVDDWRAANGVPGVAVATVSGDDIALHTVGIDGDQAPVTGDTRFLSGSVAKTFTSTIVLQLVDEGRLSLDAPASLHLPWLRGDATIRQLLTHTSGFTAGDGLAVSERGTPGTIESAARDLQRSGTPGRYAYSSANYLLLGAVIEAATGEDFAAQLDRRIVTPLGLTGTAPVGLADVPPGHRSWWGIDVDYDPVLDPSGAPYGYLVTTADDLARYARALLDGELIPAELRSAAWSVQAGAGDPARGYGFGWRVDSTGADNPVVRHTGATPGYFADVMLWPDQDRAVVVLANAYTEARAGLFANAAPSIGALSAGRGATAASADPLLSALPWLVLLPAVLGLGLLVVVLRTRRAVLRGAIGVVVLVLGTALGAVPALLGSSWRVMRIWVPDVATGLAVGIGVLAVVAVAALVLARSTRPARAPEVGRRLDLDA